MPVSFPLPSVLPPTETAFFPSSSPSRPSSPYILFIPGNPGLVTYYTTFLSTLSTLLPCPILGISLSGFHRWQPSARDSVPGYWGLQEQVTHKLALTQSIATEQGWKKVIIVAHSMGAYIALEVIRRLREENSDVEVVCGILLFPTIVDIARSPNGMLLSVIYMPRLLCLCIW
jgi:pimeloyl-ACP methyl ester carboxylesterase